MMGAGPDSWKRRDKFDAGAVPSERHLTGSSSA
jgi:hypothetical protein